MIPRAFWRSSAHGALVALLGLFLWQVQLGGVSPADIDKANTYRLLLQLRGARPAPAKVAIIDIATPFDALRSQLGALPGWAQCLSDSLIHRTPDDRWPRCAKAKLLDALTLLGPSHVVLDLFL